MLKGEVSGMVIKPGTAFLSSR